MTLKNIGHILIFAATTLGCEKRIIDYRNKYCGTWEFNYQYKYYGPGTNPLMEGTETCKIYYTKHGPREVLYFKFQNIGDSVFAVARAGTFSNCGGTGKFDSRKKMHFTYKSSDCIMGGHGGAHGYTITATKK